MAAGRTILFVCTGNTCRSPMAAVIARRLLAEALGCPVAELPNHGYEVSSAGVLAPQGEPASPPAVVLFPELNDHRSVPVDPALLAAATDVVAVSRMHAAVLLSRFPNVGPPPIVLGGDADLPDPIGGGEAEYRACAAAIRDYLEPLAREWLRS